MTHLGQPLYSIIRPKTLEEVEGQFQAVKLMQSFLENEYLPSMIFYGPPGSGKTTIAKIISKMLDAKFYVYSAVQHSTNDIKKQVYQDQNSIFVKKQILFVDEIHRYNKAQQDIFLPMIEETGVIFIGATTENPSFTVNNALLSRTRAVKFEKVDKASASTVLQRAKSYLTVKTDDETIEKIAIESDGDVRTAINIFESAYYLSDRKTVTDEDVKKVVYNPQRYDKKGDYHYRTISAFIKSMRGSDPDASLYYLVKMIEGGEDPLFILRRMIIFASEDVGNADPRALQVATSGLEAFKNIGYPEGEIILSQVVTYLATAPKSNASYFALKKTKSYYKENPDLASPQYLINKSSIAPGEEMEKYLYPHDFPNHYVKQRYFPTGKDEIPQFYEMTDIGYEGKVKKYWDKIMKDEQD